MDRQEIQRLICGSLAGEAQKNAWDLIAYLLENGMEMERGTGYWEKQNYLMVTCSSQYVCFILLGGHGEEEEFFPWTVWSDDSGSPWFETAAPDDDTREIFWRHVDICTHCGACGGGTRKIIFGKSMAPVCRTTFRFVHPDAESVACIKKMAALRKADILKSLEDGTSPA